MNFRNLTPFDALCFSALDVQDNEYPVVAMKVAYRLVALPDTPGQFTAEVMDTEPAALCTADRYVGETGHSSVLEESDLAPFKPRCDVLINGHTHAPGGKPAAQWTAGVRLSVPAPPLVIEVPPPKPSIPGGRVGEKQLMDWQDALRDANHRRANAPTRIVLLEKHLRIHGPRQFRHSLFRGWKLQDAEPATEVALGWERAFGGSSAVVNPDYPDQSPAQYLLDQVCYSNPLGRGWIEKRHEDVAWSLDTPLKQLPAPQIEHPDQPITRLRIAEQPDGDIGAAEMALLASQLDYRPAGFGVVGRAWAPRLQLAGTYDDAWQQDRWPSLPTDFDFAYWNGAPADQQCNFLPPSLRIELFNLVDPTLAPDGQASIELPGHRPFVLLRMHSGELLPLPLLTDTLLIDTDTMTITMTHRISLADPAAIRVLEARFETNPDNPLLKRAVTKPLSTSPGTI